MKHITILLLTVASLLFAGCDKLQESELQGRWNNSGQAGFGSLFQPSSFKYIEFLPKSNISISSTGGGDGVHEYSIISQGKLKVVGQLFDYTVSGSVLTLTDSEGHRTSFNKQ
jgi:hypothetical protein